MQSETRSVTGLAFCSGLFQVVMEDEQFWVKVKSIRLQM